MKKLIMGVAVAAMLVTASCAKKADSSATDTDDRYAVAASTSDSISNLYGSMVGGYILADYLNFSDDHKTPAMKEELIKGIRLALTNGESDGVLMGIQVGARMAQELQQLEEQGVKIDRETVIKNFIKAFNADSIDMESLQQTHMTYNILMQRVSNIARAREEAALAQSDEAIQNLQSGKAYLEKIKANTAGAQSTPSGLVYVIAEKGDTTTITPQSLVTLNYKGSLIDGSVFDQSNPEAPATMRPAGTIPGFSEGLQLLGKGGKATLYIPAELAYGVNAPAEIGPNQTLVFDIEILDVQNK